jgi:3-deoxy-D-manno-octulosonic-acid transferase
VSGTFALYRAAGALLEPFAPLLLGLRARAGKEDPRRLDERLGRPSAARPDGPLVWFHGASVGEAVSLLPLVERLRTQRPEIAVLVTAGTVAAETVLSTRLPEGAIHQYFPLDTPGASRRFLDAWRPDLAVFVESELWPNLLVGVRARGGRTALLSARLSERSFRNWERRPKAAALLLGGFDRVMAQDELAAARLSALGARDDGRLNLKYAGAPLPVDAAAFEHLRHILGDRPVLLAASTHPGEDEIVLDAFADLRNRDDRPMLAIAPRHPVRGADIAALARERGFAVLSRSQAEPDEACEVYVVDTLGELGVWFSLARSALVAGSLVDGVGGHNPLEPARLDCPAVTGPHFENWKAVFDDLIDRHAVAVVRDADELARLWRSDLDSPSFAELRAERALKAAMSHVRDLERAWNALSELLP